MAEPGAHVLAIRDVGERGLLVEVDTPASVRGLARWVHAQERASELEEVVPAARTVFLTGAAPALRWFAAAVAAVELPESEHSTGRAVEISVVYDGDDLADVATRTGLSVAEVISHHRDAEHVVGFFGFSPGQAFLEGVPPVLRLPRHASPRTRVPPDSLGIANEFTTIYPRASPGGWNLIGRSVGMPLWDSRKTPPNVLQVGDRVIFREPR
ncbi:MAG: 5-oxoprolinase subunit B family protein [Propionibacteriaceae bacterium]